MKRLALLALALMPLLSGCPKREVASTPAPESQPDYDAVRRRAQESHDSMPK